MNIAEVPLVSAAGLVDSDILRVELLADEELVHVELGEVQTAAAEVALVYLSVVTYWRRGVAHGHHAAAATGFVLARELSDPVDSAHEDQALLKVGLGEVDEERVQLLHQADVVRHTRSGERHHELVGDELVVLPVPKGEEQLAALSCGENGGLHVDEDVEAALGEVALSHSLLHLLVVLVDSRVGELRAVEHSVAHLDVKVVKVTH